MKTLRVVLLACSFLLFLYGPASALNGVTYVPGNPACEDLGLGDFSYKVDPPESGTHSLDGLNTVTFTILDGQFFDWSASIGIDAVIVKGGPDANVYTYDPESVSGMRLHPPDNPFNGQPYAVSHIYFCFDYKLQVTTTPATFFVRDYAWSVSKSAEATDLVLSPGEIFALPYNVVVSAAGFVDSDWSFSADISIHNPSPIVATIVGISDNLSGSPIPVDCGAITFPYILAGGATLLCSVQGTISNGVFSTNEVDVATTGVVGPGSASTTVDFQSASIDVKDRCAAVSDSLAGPLGIVCARDNIPTTFIYNLDLGPYEQCGQQYQVTNQASIMASDSGATQSANSTVNISVPCVGCTLSQGYWKTHSNYGPAPYDDTWALLPSGAATTFFLSGQTCYGILWTGVKGNAYYNLAKAYITAKLNKLNGAASTLNVNSTLTWAENFFNHYGPSANLSTSLRANALNYASLLDQYNNGLIGPGHCSE
jgi:hypothetical protein